MNRHAVDQGPAVPVALIPRTRHQCRRAASTGAVSCEAVTVRSSTSGDVNELESSTWTRYDDAAATSDQSSDTGCLGEESWAGLSSRGAVGVAGGVVPVVFSSSAKLGAAPTTPSVRSVLASPLSWAETIAKR